MAFCKVAPYSEGQFQKIKALYHNQLQKTLCSAKMLTGIQVILGYLQVNTEAP